VVAAGQALRNGAAGVTTKAIRQPPFAPAGLLKVAAGCSAETDEVRRFHTFTFIFDTACPGCQKLPSGSLWLHASKSPSIRPAG
jgi:hypothetical protein